MSFNDLNDLEEQPTECCDEAQSPEFVNLTKSISAKVFKLSSNVTLVHRYIGLLGTPRDTEKMRTSLMDTLTRTQKLTKELLPNIRELSRWDAEEVGPNGRYEQKKLTAEYQKAALDFQNAQRLALEKQKDYVKGVKAIIEEESRVEDRSYRSYEHQQEQQRLHSLDNSEIEFNEQLIEEREQEIQDIEMGINELNEIFKDLATIITEQGTVLDDISVNVDMMAGHTRAAEQELRQANRYQKGARKRACWLTLILVIILTVVLLAVLT